MRFAGTAMALGRRVRHGASGSARTALATLAIVLILVGAGLLASQAPLGSSAVAASGVEITSGPAETEASSEATFAFSSSDGATSFECSLDAGEFQPCTSPKSYSGLANGPHFFAVRVQPADEGTETTPAQREWTVENLKPCTEADEPANFSVYSLGRSVGDLPLTSINRRCDPYEAGAPGRANYVSYVYGVCPGIEEGTENICQAPLSIQSWPACERSLADYELLPGVPYPREKLGELEGVPAYSFDDGTRVELYTSTATIAIFVTDPALVDAAVAAIQPEAPSEPPGEPAPADPESSDLPPPTSGAIAGRLSCS